MNHDSEKQWRDQVSNVLIIRYAMVGKPCQRILVNLRMTFLIGARKSSLMNPSSILESKKSVALSTDSREPLAVKDAKKGSASFSETPDSRTISRKKKRSSVRRPSFNILFGLFLF
jgi:hypothetical protein